MQMSRTWITVSSTDIVDLMKFLTKSDHDFRIVEETGARMFGIEDDELVRRRQYVVRVKQTVQVCSFSYLTSSSLTTLRKAEHSK